MINSEAYHIQKHSESCEYPEGCSCGAEQWNRLVHAHNWYKKRVDMLGREQRRMRDPERTLVCDILANGQLLPDPNGERYGKYDKTCLYCLGDGWYVIPTGANGEIPE